VRRALPLLVAFLALASVLLPASAHDPSSELDEVRAEIDSLASKINQARGESRRVGAELAAARDRLDEIQGELAEAQGKLDTVAASIAAEEANRDLLLSQMEAIEAELTDTRTRLRALRDDLEVQAITMYMDASASLNAMVLNFESVTDAAVGMAYASGVADEKEDLLTTFEFLKREEERQHSLLEDRKSEVEVILAGLEVERTVLEAEASRVEALRVEAEANLADVRSLLNQINAQIAAAEEHKDGLEEDAKRLERELAALQANSGERPGTLAWPVDGWVSSLFGYRIHPILGTKRLHTGIDIAAMSGSPITAAGSGVVILSGPYGGYGNAVVIDHGGGLATLYAHQSKIVVSKGQALATGDLVGYVGCTGLCTGPHLHFETRENGTPVDPMKYLGG